MGKYYTLYYNKKTFELKIKLCKITNIRYGFESYVDGDRVVRYNDCYCICGTRKPLKQCALEMKEKWIRELEENLEHVKNIKI